MTLSVRLPYLFFDPANAALIGRGLDPHNSAFYHAIWAGAWGLGSLPTAAPQQTSHSNGPSDGAARCSSNSQNRVRMPQSPVAGRRCW